MRTSSKVAALLALLAILSSVSHAQDMRRRKKLIETGWDCPDGKALLANLAEMEKRPFDGVIIALTGRSDDKKPCDLRTTFVHAKWQRAWFKECIEELKACKFNRFTDNFITLGANPGNVDWFDDEGWASIVEHWRIAAWIARQCGFKGILFDPEPYTPPHSQYTYAAQSQRDRHTFEEYRAKARQRGREVMQAVAEEFPDIVLFSYFMNSVVASATGQADPRALLAGEGYGLLPAFIDGWLDAAPPTVTLVDGCESAYRYNSAAEYLEAAAAIKGVCQELVSPANRAKYRSQVQVSFGIYLDAYWNPKTSPWYIDGLGGPRVDRLRENLRTALRVADEYVWVYGEKYRWWPTPSASVKGESWPEAIPGCQNVLALARDPIDHARGRIAAGTNDPSFVNLARNGDFGADKAADTEGHTDVWKEGRPPAGWGAWQSDASKGTFTCDREIGLAGKGSARAENVANGCFVQGTPGKSGETYAVQARCRIQGKGRAHVRVRWQTSDGHWTAEALDRIIPCQAPRDGWGEMFGVVDVPQGAGRLVILLCVTGQSSPRDAAWFDDVSLHRIE